MEDGITREKYRVAHWDNIKFTMITLMVIGHFTDSVIQYSDVCKSIFLFIYAYHMPVLLFISGLFYKRTKYVEKTLYYISSDICLPEEIHFLTM